MGSFAYVFGDFAHILLGDHAERRAVIAVCLVPLLTIVLLGAASLVLGLWS